MQLKSPQTDYTHTSQIQSNGEINEMGWNVCKWKNKHVLIPTNVLR